MFANVVAKTLGAYFLEHGVICKFVLIHSVLS